MTGCGLRSGGHPIPHRTFRPAISSWTACSLYQILFFSVFHHGTSTILERGAPVESRPFASAPNLSPSTCNTRPVSRAETSEGKDYKDFISCHSAVDGRELEQGTCMHSSPRRCLGDRKEKQLDQSSLLSKFGNTGSAAPRLADFDPSTCLQAVST